VAEQGIRALSSQVIYADEWLALRRDEIEYPDGRRSHYAVVDKPDFALVIPAERGGFHLVEEYRYPLQRQACAFPQGSFPHRRSGDPEELARRELAEETGLRAGRLTRLGYLHCAHGLTGQGFHAFLATGLLPGEPCREPEEQGMRHFWVPRGRFLDMIAEGVVTDDASVAAYTLLLLHEREHGLSCG
jgi:8-oxo-dGTP pyrophosphatase MutT (NUDIX family)